MKNYNFYDIEICIGKETEYSKIPYIIERK